MGMTWWKAAGIRAARTVAQTAVAMVGTSAVLSEVDWAVVASSAALAGILSLLTSVAGLPEVKGEAAPPARPDITLADMVVAAGLLTPEGKKAVRAALGKEDGDAG